LLSANVEEQVQGKLARRGNEALPATKPGKSKLSIDFLYLSGFSWKQDCL